MWLLYFSRKFSACLNSDQPFNMNVDIYRNTGKDSGRCLHGTQCLWHEPNSIKNFSSIKDLISSALDFSDGTKVLKVTETNLLGTKDNTRGNKKNRHTKVDEGLGVKCKRGSSGSEDLINEKRLESFLMTWSSLSMEQWILVTKDTTQDFFSPKTWILKDFSFHFMLHQGN